MSSVCPLCVLVNVNTTDATTGATALLLPAQNTHTLHDPMLVCPVCACVSSVCPLVCACVSRVCPGSPRCLFTQAQLHPSSRGASQARRGRPPALWGNAQACFLPVLSTD